MSLLGDNQAANLMAAGQAGVRKVRHLSLADLFVREVCHGGRVTVKYIPTDVNTADMFTKVLPGNKLKPLTTLLGLNEEAEADFTDSRYEKMSCFAKVCDSMSNGNTLVVA